MTEVHRDLPLSERQRPITEQMFAAIGEALHGTTEVEAAYSLHLSDSPFNDIALDLESDEKSLEAIESDPVIGKEWSVHDPTATIRIARYGEGEQRELVKSILYPEVTNAPTPHGHVSFAKSIDKDAFHGIIYFLGDEKKITEVIVKAERIKDNPANNFAMLQFATTVGVSEMFSLAGLSPESTWECDLPAMYKTGREIAGSLQNLQQLASAT